MIDKEIVISESRKGLAFSSAVKQLGFVPSKHELSGDILSYYSLCKDYEDLKKMPDTYLREKLLDQISAIINGNESLVDQVARLKSELDSSLQREIGHKKSIVTLQMEVQSLRSDDSYEEIRRENEDLSRQLRELRDWNVRLIVELKYFINSRLHSIFLGVTKKDYLLDITDDCNVDFD